MLADQVAGRATVGRGTEERAAVKRVPDHVLLEPQVEAAGQDVAVVDHGVIPEVRGVDEGSQHHEDEGQPGRAPPPHLRAIGERAIEKARPAEDRLGGKRDLDELLRREHQDQDQQQEDHLAPTLPEAPAKHEGQERRQRRRRQPTTQALDVVAEQKLPAGQQPEQEQRKDGHSADAEGDRAQPALVGGPVAQDEIVERGGCPEAPTGTRRERNR